MTHRTKIIILAILALGLITATMCLSPIAQDMTYHHFADQRTLFGLPNFADVTGNAFFVLFGLIGLWHAHDPLRAETFTMCGEKQLWLVFFGGAALVGFGSAYYHLAPDNTTLVWDRLPMTIAFMSFFALIIMERIHPRAGLILSPFLLLIGAASVFYWDYTESLGQGDLRPYALVQFLPLCLIPVMLWLFPARYNGMVYLGHTVGWYVIAKGLEHFDKSIFSLLNGVVSGHTLKHLASAVAIYSMVNYIRFRQTII
jgi:hypothetical protein